MSETSALRQDQPRADRDIDRPFSDVLCAVDGSRRSFAAVDQAALLAGSQGHLTLLAVAAVSGTGAYRNAAISPPRAEHLLERAAEIAEHRGVATSTILAPKGPVPQAILERAGEHDLLAIGAPAASWLGERLIESVGLAKLGSLTKPLLACREHAGGAAFAERVLIASDGLEGSEELARLAGRLARGSVVLLYATDVESDERSRRIEEQGRMLEEQFGHALEVRIEIGDAADAIVQAGHESDASLIVMGSRRRTGLKAIGSVSRHVVHSANCSVLLVAPGQPWR
jgi:nucleotide-binding universal stress UspA family protein